LSEKFKEKVKNIKTPLKSIHVMVHRNTRNNNSENKNNKKIKK
jgi:hypothetical protein